MSSQPSRSNNDRPRMGLAGGPPTRRIEKASNPRRALLRLLPYLRPFKTQLILVFVFVTLYTALGLVGPFLLGVAIDDYIIPADLPGLVRIAVIMLVTYLAFNLFQAGANWTMARVSQRALKAVRRDLFGHMQTLSIGYFDQHHGRRADEPPDQ
jgi:ATP-binding cassette, subfamily B, multidrug efflux pump